MNLEARLARMEHQIDQLRRELAGAMARLATVQPGAAIRIARVATVPAFETVPPDPDVFDVYGVNFIDATFDDAAGDTNDQTLQTTSRAEEEYRAASIRGCSFAAGDICIVARYNGRWWIISPSVRCLIGKTLGAITKGDTGSVTLWRGAPKGSEVEKTDDTIEVYARGADYDADLWVMCLFVEGGWEIIGECPDEEAPPEE